MAYWGNEPAKSAVKIGDDVILSSHIDDGVIVNADINASAAIATSKISGALTSVAGSHGLATSATTDTTNASNISSGTLAAARVATLNQSTTGSAATLTTARNIGGVSFNGSAAINLPGVNASGNQNTTGQAGTVATIAGLAPNTATTQATQGAITSVGTLTSLTVDDITLNGSTISDSGDLTIDTEADLTLTALSDIIHQTTSTNSTAGHHIFKSYNTEIMRIDGGNNRVGIVEQSPETALHLTGTGGGVGSAVMVEDSTGSSNTKKFRMYVNSDKGYLDAPNDAFNSAVDIVNFDLSNGDATFAGNVEINDGLTINKGSDLNLILNSTGRYTAMYLHKSDVEKGYWWFDNTNTETIFGTRAGNLIFQTTGTTALTLDTSQNATFAGTVNLGGYLYKGTRGGSSATTELGLYTADDVTGAQSQSPYVTIVCDETATRNPQKTGISLHNKNTTGTDTWSPMIAFSQKEVGSSGYIYDSQYAMIAGQDKGQSSDANWRKGDITFWTRGSSAPMVQRARFDYTGNLLILSGGSTSGEGNPRTSISIESIKASSSSNYVYVDTEGMLFQGGATSDERMKKDFEPLTGSLVKINNLSPISFKWKYSDEEDIGFTAQDVQSEIPLAVVEDKIERTVDDETFKPLLLEYMKLIPYMAGAIQELSAKVEALENA